MTDDTFQNPTKFAPDPARVFAFLERCPAYSPTPLRQVRAGSGQIFIKDETNRMALGAFKALGGAYAVARLIEDRWRDAFDTRPAALDLQDPAVRDFARQFTFVCASAGNHGMAVAVGAAHVGARARVHLAETVAQSFADRLASKGAEIVRSGAVYEDSMTAAMADAEQPGHILLADGSWPGYVRPPALVMEGYTVLAEELRQSFAEAAAWPSHVFLQAGVGGLAAAVAHMIRANWPAQPRIVVVEPDAAPCLLQSHRAGRPVTVQGPISSMGRLDCKEPSHIAFQVLEACDVDYTLVDDAQAASAQENLRQMHGIETTPSGAAGFAAATAFLRRTDAPESVRPLVIVTEGRADGS